NRCKPSVTVPAAKFRPNSRQEASNRSVGREVKYLSKRISTQSEMPYRPLGISLGGGGAVKVRLPSQVQVRSYRRRRILRRWARTSISICSESSVSLRRRNG